MIWRQEAASACVPFPEDRTDQEVLVATAVLIVRARLNNLSDRRKFDDWYRTEHLPSALRAFRAQRAWRCWSRTNPLVHLALYEFPSVEEAEAILDSQALASQIAEFDRYWGTEVTRTREIVEVAEELSAPAS
jgi:hypothetical protein